MCLAKKHFWNKEMNNFKKPTPRERWQTRIGERKESQSIPGKTVHLPWTHLAQLILEYPHLPGHLLHKRWEWTR